MDQQLMRPATQTETRQRTQGFEDALRHSFAQAWDDATSAEHEALLRRWSDSIAKWLRKSSRSKSAHTERTYTRCLDSWWCFIQASPWLVSEKRREVYEAFLKERWIGPADYRSPWEVTQDDVQAYVMFLESEHPAWPWEAPLLPQATILAGEDERPMKPGCAAATVGQYMAAASSFYSYVRGVTVLSNGIEVPIFADRSGRRRENPFKGSNVERPRTSPYGHSRPLSAKQLARMWEAIGPTPGETPQQRAEAMGQLAAGPAKVAARDRALYRLFIYTGRRAAEAARLRWRDIEDHGGQYSLRWTGKGAKTDQQALPADAYWEIVCWLKAAGRWPAAPEDYVFVAVQPGSAAAFGHTPDPDRPISTGQINNVVKKLARRAGIDPAQVHTHTLRHSFAHVFDESRPGDLNQLRIILGHSSLATTTIYLNSPAMKRPVDNYSQGFQQVLGF